MRGQAGLAGGGYHLYTEDESWSFTWLGLTDCAVSGGYVYCAGPRGMGLTNNLFERAEVLLLYDGPLSHYNDYLRGGGLLAWDMGGHGWRLHDNVFEAAWLGSTEVTNSHNVDVNMTDRLTPTNLTDLVLESLAWQTGPLGRYYQPLDSPLRDTGSRWATNAGLCHYTTTTNQVKEGSSLVDRGLHYVALDGLGPESQAVDTDGDGLADYAEDADGIGVCGQGESHWLWPYVCATPAYEPGFWNTILAALLCNNCYNYANNVRTDTYAQPGYASGEWCQWWGCLTAEGIFQYAVNDGLIPTRREAVAPCGMTKVALVIWPYRDYHWYRQDADRLWSHKLGGTPATNLDNSGNIIVDPELADRGRYVVFAGYFWTCSSLVQGQGHATIDGPLACAY